MVVFDKHSGNNYTRILYTRKSTLEICQKKKIDEITPTKLNTKVVKKICLVCLHWSYLSLTRKKKKDWKFFFFWSNITLLRIDKTICHNAGKLWQWLIVTPRNSGSDSIFTLNKQWCITYILFLLSAAV